MKLRETKWENQTIPIAGMRCGVRARPLKGLAGRFSLPNWATRNKQSDCPQNTAHLTGYRWKSKRVSWVAYDAVHQAWQGEHGGKQPETAYRRFVEAGVDTPPENPLFKATGGWLLGSQAFVERIKGLMKNPKYADEVPLARRLSSVPLEDVLQVVADHYRVEPASFAVKHSKESSRDVAAWLARRLTTATLRELSSPFGLVILIACGT